MKKRARAMTIDRDEVVHETLYTRLVVRHYTDITGTPRMWEMIAQNPKGVGSLVAAVTPDHKLVLERSYRIPSRSDVIELPGGCDDIGREEPAEVACRELREETGYTVASTELLAKIHNDPGSSDLKTFLFVGLGAKKTATPVLGDAEIIETVLVPLDALFDFLSQSNTPVDPKVWVAYAYLHERGLIA